MTVPILRLLISLLLVAGCSRDAVLLKVASPEADHFARTRLGAMSSTTPAEIAPLLTPRLGQVPGILDSIASIQPLFEALGAVDSIALINAQVIKPRNSGLVSRALLYLIKGERGELVADIRLLEEFGEHYIDGLRVQPVTSAMRAAHGFRRHLRPGQLLMLLMMLATVAFVVWSAVSVARTSMPRRWLWAIVAFLGVMQITMNWSTGAISVQPLSLQLLVATFGKPMELGPWWMAVSFPAGALLALNRRRTEFARRAAAEDAALQAMPEPITPAV